MRLFDSVVLNDSWNDSFKFCFEYVTLWPVVCGLWPKCQVPINLFAEFVALYKLYCIALYYITEYERCFYIVALTCYCGVRSRRNSRPGTPCSRRSHVSEAGTPHSPTTPLSPTVHSPKHVTANNNSGSCPGRKRKSSRGSMTSQVLITVESPVSTTPGGSSKRPSTGSFRVPVGAGSRKPSCYSTTSALAHGNGVATSGSAVSKSALPACTSTTALTASQPTRSPVKFAVAGVAMLAGTSALLLSYALGGSRWTLVGSTLMGLGSLVFVMAICWYLANTPGDQEDERRRCESAVQIHVVDERHLARLIKQGACVKNVGVVWNVRTTVLIFT